jgi:hypothetical protein
MAEISQWDEASGKQFIEQPQTPAEEVSQLGHVVLAGHKLLQSDSAS